MLELKCQENARAIAQQMTSGGGGSDVTVTQVVESGTKIATIEVDDVETDLYAPEVAVTQVLSSGTKIATIAVGDTSTDLYCETVPTPETPVYVTADGVKTYSQLLDELYALIDSSKISYKSSCIFDHHNASETKDYFNILRSTNTSYIFVRPTSASGGASVASYNITNTGSTYMVATGSTRSDSSSEVPSVNATIEIVY